MFNLINKFLTDLASPLSRPQYPFKKNQAHLITRIFLLGVAQSFTILAHAQVQEPPPSGGWYYIDEVVQGPTGNNIFIYTAPFPSPMEACESAFDHDIEQNPVLLTNGIRRPITVKVVDPNNATCYSIYASYPNGGFAYHVIKRRDQTCPSGGIYNPVLGICEDPGKPAPRKMLGAPCDPMGCQAPSSAQGNPINTAIGNKHQAETDYDERREGAVSFTRYFNSLDSLWRTNYSASILKNSSSSVILKKSDGRQSLFTLQSNSYVAEATELGSLSKTSTEWTYLDPSGSSMKFDNQGRLIQTTSRNGFSQRLTYTFLNTNSHLYQIDVADDFGGKLSFKTSVSDQPASLSVGELSVTFNYGVPSYQSAPGAKVLKEAIYSRAGTSWSRQYIYDSPGRPTLLTGIIDESNNRYATWSYDSQGRADSSKHGAVAGQTIITYGSDNSVLVTNPLGGIKKYKYQTILGINHVTSVSRGLSESSLGEEKTFEYDDKGFLQKSTDALGVVTLYEHNTLGLETSRVEAFGTTTGQKRTMQTDWNLGLRRPTQSTIYDAASMPVKQSTWTYNIRGQILTESNLDPSTGNSRTTTTSYCEADDVATAGSTCPILGLTKSIDGPRTDVSDLTTYTYYPSDAATCATSPSTCSYHKGDLWKVTNALGHNLEILRYDDASRPLSIKDANGVTTDYEYSPQGWLTARKVRGSNTTSETDDHVILFEYWPIGLVKKITQPDDTFSAYSYDAAHRLTDITDNGGNTIHYTLDNAGNRVQEDTKDAEGALRRTLSRVYNQLDQLQAIKDANNHAVSFTYDANDNPDITTDALNRATGNDYDSLNRLARTLQDIGGINAETRFTYDTLGNLTKVTDPKGLETVYTYNGLSDLIHLASPDTGITSYTYDSSGNRRTQTDARGVTTTYNYDALGRLTGIAYPDASLNIVYIYDTVSAICNSGENFAVGQLSKIIDASGSTDYCYDRFGRLTRKTQTTNDKTFTLRYAYTKAGQLQSIIYPDGTLVDYVRDALGQIAEIGVTRIQQTRQILLNQTTYAPFGPSTGWTYGNSRNLVRALNQNYQPAIIHDNAAGGLSLHYSFDASGNLTQLNNANQTTTLARYDYDALNRLTDTKDGPTGTVIEHYDYDITGNRIGLTNVNGTNIYTYPTNSHHLISVGNVVRTYDDAGNTLSIGATAKQFVYNDTNRMTQVKANGTLTMNYTYNGRGEQVRKSHDTDSTYVFYDEAGHWLGYYDKDGATIQQAIWLDDLPVGLLTGSGAAQITHYIEPDHLGTPRVVIDASRNTVVWIWDIKGEIFGSTHPNQDPDNDNIPLVLDMRFPGQNYESSADLNYNYFRNYDADVGRYTQSDPIGLRGGIGTYAYAGANPATNVDYFGLEYGAAYSAIYRADSIGLGLASALRGPTSTTQVRVRCGKLPAMMGGSSGGVHCEVVAECPSTGERIAFGIGGGGNGIWDRLFGGKIPPEYANTAPATAPAGVFEYAASCGSGEECGCKAIDCLKRIQSSSQPPPYYALWQNSNAYAHSALTQCGCSLGGSPPGAVAW